MLVKFFQIKMHFSYKNIFASKTNFKKQDTKTLILLDIKNKSITFK